MNQTDRRTRSYSMNSTPSRPLKHKQQLPQGTKVPVVYYLCRNHHLDHPHFVEVPLASPNGLYLRDVIARLNAVRGKGMSAMYSWSCKRSYRNGFVWHDLEDDDLVIAAHGNEYILKGTELLDQSHSERLHHSPEPAHREPHTFSSSSPTVGIKEAKPPPWPRQEEEFSPNFYRSGSSDNISPEPMARSQVGSRGPIEYTVHKAGGWADASTQTVDTGGSRKCGSDKHMKGVLIESEPLDIKFNESRRSRAPCFIQESEGDMAAMSPPAISSSSSPLGVNMDTLESLIRDEVSRMNSFTIFDEEVLVPAKAKLKTTKMLVQLITCGSISTKDNNNIGLVRTYNPRLSNVSFPSPMFSSSTTMGEREFMSDKPTPNGLRQEEQKYFRGSMMKAKPHKEGGSEGMPSLKLSSPCAKDRSAESHGSERKQQVVVDSAYTKRLLDKIKITSCKESQNETTMSPASDSRNSSARQDCNKSTPFNFSGGSRRITDTYSVEKRPRGLHQEL